MPKASTGARVSERTGTQQQDSPRKPIRLICLDMDGTLLDSKSQLRPRVRASLHRAHQSGIAIAIVTGRNLDSIVSVMNDLGLVVELITSSGSYIQTADGRTWEVGLTREQALDIVDVTLKAGSALFLDRPGPSWCVGDEDLLRRHAALTTDVFTTDLTEALRLTPIKISVINETHEIEELYKILAERHPDLDLTRPLPTVVDVTDPRATKGIALQRLGEMLGIPLDQVAAIGDSDNDLSMFREAALPIAMGNASDTVKAAAAWVAPSNDEDGVAWAVDRIIDEDGRKATLHD